MLGSQWEMKAAKFTQRRRHDSDVNTMELNVHIIILVFKDLSLLFKVCLMRRCGVHYSSALVRTAFKWSSNLSVYQDHLEDWKAQITGLPPPSFWFSISGLGPKNWHFWHVPRWCWCCWSREHTSRTTI